MTRSGQIQTIQSSCRCTHKKSMSLFNTSHRSVNGYQPWLEDVLQTCINDRCSELSGLNRELQFADTVKFPERSNRRSRFVPWNFIIDEMNVPEVYYWTFNQTPPSTEFTSDGGRQVSATCPSHGHADSCSSGQLSLPRCRMDV